MGIEPPKQAATANSDFTDYIDKVFEGQKENIREYGYIDFDGESNTDFYARVTKTMKMLEKLNCETVAIFTHAGWLRGMLDTVVGAYLPRNHVRCANCTIGIFEYTNGNWWFNSWINFFNY